MVSSFFPDSVISGMRALSDSTLTDTCEVRMPAKASIPGGGNTVTYPAPALFTVPCRVAPISFEAALKQIVEDKVSNEKPLWNVSFEAATVIPNDARLVVTGETNGTSWSKTLKVLGRAEQYDNEVYARVIAQEV